MSTLWTLRRLYSLDTSSPDFLRNLYCLFRHDEDERYLYNLQGSKLARLVDFLDQTLNAIPANRDISRKCLHKLQEICGHRSTLPSSYIVPGQIVIVGSGPIATDAIADVWEGIYLSKRVSIKCLKIPPDDGQTLKKSFFEAAVMWKRLRHPNIIPFVGVTMNPLQVVSEWMSNGTLTEFVNEYPGANRISLLLDVAEGLGYLHANHVIHGNLDGSTILVGHDFHARLTGFEFDSIARGVSSATQKSGYKTAWAAPEILKGAGTITREADIFGFGMVMIEVFTGRGSFSEFAAPAITSRIIDDKRPTRPREVQGLGLTDSLWNVTVRCWDQDPAQRPTMTEVVRLLRDYRMAIRWTKITDIPAKLLINNLLPFCEAKDVLSLGCTNRFFALVANDDTFWRQRLAIEYNFTRPGAAKTSSWKFPYHKLNPRVFVWGDKGYGQLGLSQFPETTFSDVPFPVELRLPGVRVVGLAMSGWALHIRGADGSVYVCGTLRFFYTRPPGHGGFSDPCTSANTPLKLQLPAPTYSISCGDYHAMTLDANFTVWNFRSWGRPFKLNSSSLDCSSPKTTPVQIECGDEFSTVLTKSGDVYVWWPFKGTLGDRYLEGMAELDKDESTKAIIPQDGTVIPCHTWEINEDPVKLPALPDLPDLPATGLPEDGRRKETKLIEIAALDDFLVGLTNKGHVLRLDGMNDEHSVRLWRYLPNYSEIDRVKKHPAFRTTTDDNGQERLPEVELSSDTMLITRISARFGSFFAYSSHMVLKGEKSTPEELPIIIPELQNRSGISVVNSYCNFGALTSGKLLAWGRYCGGALGLGDPGALPAGSPGGYAEEGQRVQALASGPPPAVAVPTEVRFDHGLTTKRRAKWYCFAAAMGVNHAAALVVNLAEDEIPPEGLK